MPKAAAASSTVSYFLPITTDHTALRLLLRGQEVLMEDEEIRGRAEEEDEFEDAEELDEEDVDDEEDSTF